ncbi:anaerobic ribonucleoside-triphosphate reductase activating protein [Helicobacter burdigaliensis]|uniref:anaerobic ribonucleoside-triphosphate reductase activating protein n=1 Tax=Helicobacter burdigaliensis TaxID=2315334 RepID=UPI000EF66202|nr:anaerobic ribonucleoside-triphosphate reductase activating protein [Helicobacter burdigaliensis]
MIEKNTIFLKLAGIVEESIVDGFGLRYVIFTQGCLHKCKGCQNPHTHDLNGGYLKDSVEILEELRKNPLLKGVTFSGGEPFLQSKNLAVLAKEIKSFGLDLTIYSGFTFEELVKKQDYYELLELCDVLIDGRFILEKKDLSLRFRGSTNQRLIDVQKTLSLDKIVEFS